MQAHSPRPIKRTIRKFAVNTAILIALPLSNVNAAIIDHGNYLTDTNTGLEWLDVTASVGLSYGYVSAEFGTGGQFDGWRYATGNEFNQLLSSWTGVINNGFNWTETTGSIPAIDNLAAMLGSTLDTSYLNQYGVTYDSDNGYAEGEALDETRGMLADQSGNGRYVAYIMDRESHDDFAQYTAKDGYAAHYESTLHDFYGAWDLGSFLVRNTFVTPPITSVSAPSSLALFGLGILSLGFARLRK